MAALHARHPAQQHPAPAGLLFKKTRPLLDRHPPGHLTHGGQERQRAVVGPHRLVGDADDLPVEQHLGELRHRRQMEIGEEDLPLPEQAVLRRQRLLDLDHQPGPPVNLVGRGDDLGPGPAVLRIADAAAQARPPLHQHGMAAMGQAHHPGRHHPDPELLLLDLPGNAYDHRLSP